MRTNTNIRVSGVLTIWQRGIWPPDLPLHGLCSRLNDVMILAYILHLRNSLVKKHNMPNVMIACSR